MNNIDGTCTCCGEPVQYDGTLPIICVSCREARKQIQTGRMAQLLPSGNLNPRLFLPDSRLMPQPKTMADFR